MLGDIIFTGQNGYQEKIIANNTKKEKRIIACGVFHKHWSKIDLFRVEYEPLDSTTPLYKHQVFYTRSEATTFYRSI